MLDTDVFLNRFILHPFQKKPHRILQSKLGPGKAAKQLADIDLRPPRQSWRGKVKWWVMAYPMRSEPLWSLRRGLQPIFGACRDTIRRGLELFPATLGLFSSQAGVCFNPPNQKNEETSTIFGETHPPKLRISTMFGVFFYPDETHPPNHLRWFTTPIRNSPRFTWTSARWPPGEALNLWFWEGASTKSIAPWLGAPRDGYMLGLVWLVPHPFSGEGIARGFKVWGVHGCTIMVSY